MTSWATQASVPSTIEEEARDLLDRVHNERDRILDRVGSPRPVRLTVGIATYDDFDGAYFSASSALLHHPEVMGDAEVLILDNHPRGIEAEALAQIAEEAENVRYVPYEKVQSTAVRDVLFREAAGEVVVVLDSHVLLQAGALKAILDYFEDPAHSRDMVQGPLLTLDGRQVVATHMEPGFSNAMYGQWGVDPRAEDASAEPFEIELHGLGTFAMRKDAWPGINPAFRGFGGEEGYIHERVRQAGGRVACLPAYRWVHRFSRPRGVPYRLQLHDRVHNYLVGWTEIGYDLDEVIEHFALTFPEAFPTVLHEVLQAVHHPFNWVDGIYVLADPDRFAPRSLRRAELSALGATYSFIDVPAAGSARERAEQAFGLALDEAWQRGQRSILVLDEQLAIGAALPHALKHLIGDLDRSTLVLDSADSAASSFLPGALYVASVDELRTLISSRPQSAASTEWWGGWGIAQRQTSVALNGAGNASTVGGEQAVGRAFVLTPMPRAERCGEDTARGLTGWGIGDVRGVRYIERSALSPKDAYGAAINRAIGDSQPESGITLVAPSGLEFIRGGADLLARAVAELGHHEWDVLTLSGAGAVLPAAGDGLVARSHGGNSGAAFLVNPRSVRKLQQALEGAVVASPEDFGRLLDQANAASQLRVWTTVVPLLLDVTNAPGELSQELLSWFERPVTS